MLSHNISLQMERYSVPLVEVVEEAVAKFNVSTNSVINFGCATGLTSFLLSANFEKVHLQHYTKHDTLLVERLLEVGSVQNSQGNCRKKVPIHKQYFLVKQGYRVQSIM